MDSPQSTTEFTSKCSILADIWLNYRDDEIFEDFINYNDLGLPLAYLADSGVVETKTEQAQAFINETFDLLLAGVGVEDTGFTTLDEILDKEQNRDMTNNPKSEELEIIRDILDKLNKLNKTLFPSLVWLWVWDIIDNFYQDEELFIRTQDIVWEALLNDTPAFTLEYGTEHLYEWVRDWMFNNNLMIDIADMDSEEIEKWTADKEYGTYVQGRPHQRLYY